MKYFNSIVECIGSTPLVRLQRIEKEYNLNYKLFAKVEKFNPTGSIKDRAAFNMIKNALEKGIINENTLIIETTSGNTGIGLALVCAYYNLKLHIYMPSSFSIERRKIMEFLGAKIILTDCGLGMKGALIEAKKEMESFSNSFMPSQFENMDNMIAHYEYTAEEIILDLDKKVDVLISPIGTGGTIMGIAKRLKDENIITEIIGVEPNESPLLSQNKSGPHKIEGIGANFIPPLIDKNYIERFITVSSENAYIFAKLVAQKEGIFVGPSSGASLAASLTLDNNIYKDKNVVIIFPDGGERYLSVYE